MVDIGNDWDEILRDEFQSGYYQDLRRFLRDEYRAYKVYPPMHDIFNALKYTSFSDVRVVILGQDPYINPGEAHGLSFSVRDGVRIPPSLQNIYKEIVADVGGYLPKSGCLIKWSEQGVLLLNSTLTVRAGLSKSHSKKGWEILTDTIIKSLNNKKEPTVFMLWGNDAKSKAGLVTNPMHLVLTAAHPSPLAGGKFFGCKHFSTANSFLKKNGLDEIDWQIE